MSRRRAESQEALSLDSFLDIVTNVVGMLILVAVVTVLGARDVAVSAGPSVLAPPAAAASRLLFECTADQLFLVDEESHARRVAEEVKRRAGDGAPTTDQIEAALRDEDVGDEVYRVSARPLPEGIAWVYERRDGAGGVSSSALDAGATSFHRALDALEPGGFVYFAVREDGFEVFRRAREIAAARGIAVGWHPVEGGALRLASSGSLGRKVQ